MPGNITNSTVSGVLPFSLSTQFTENREWPALVSEYKDGSSQRKEQAGSSRRSYSLSKRLTPAAMNTLRAFYLSHLGQAFKVYIKRDDYNALNGNYKLMRFDSPWQESFDMARSNTSITLMEVA